MGDLKTGIKHDAIGYITTIAKIPNARVKQA